MWLKMVGSLLGIAEYLIRANDYLGSRTLKRDPTDYLVLSLSMCVYYVYILEIFYWIKKLNFFL